MKCRADTFVMSAFALGLALLFGTCAHSAVSCWQRGGHVVKNLFDWPVCLERTAPSPHQEPERQ